jgi:hypothetical protein
MHAHADAEPARGRRQRRPWLPADAVMTEVIEGCAALSRAIALAAPRILNAPVSCSVSSFNQTSPPVIVDSQADRTSGVVRATAAIRPAAATTSSNVGGRRDVVNPPSNLRPPSRRRGSWAAR